MALKIKRAGADEYGRTLKLLLGGDPGSGKTRLSSTFPNVFYANADAGMMSVVDRQVPFVDIDSSESLMQLLAVLRQTPKIRQQSLGVPASTIVLDTIDSIQKILIEERKKEQKKDTLAIADWGWLGDQLRVIVRNFRNLDMNVIFTCHLKTVEDSETGQTFIKPALQGQMAEDLPAYTDVCGLLKATPTTIMRDGKQTRVLQRLLQTGPDARHPWLKDRSGKLPVDFDVDLNTDGPRMLKVVYGGLPVVPSEAAEVKAVKPEAKRQEPETTLRSTQPHPSEEKAIEPEPEKSSPVEGQSPVEEPEAAVTASSEEPEPVALTSNEEEVGETPPEPEPDPEPEPEPEPEPSLLEVAEEVVAAAESAPTEELDEEPVASSNGQVHEAVDPEMICDECGDPIESEDQRDLSLIRFRKRLDRKCFLLAKKDKAKT
jgi:hypothetical protein